MSIANTFVEKEILQQIEQISQLCRGHGIEPIEYNGEDYSIIKQKIHEKLDLIEAKQDEEAKERVHKTIALCEKYEIPFEGMDYDLAVRELLFSLIERHESNILNETNRRGRPLKWGTRDKALLVIRVDELIRNGRAQGAGTACQILARETYEGKKWGSLKRYYRIFKNEIDTRALLGYLG